MQQNRFYVRRIPSVSSLATVVLSGMAVALVASCARQISPSGGPEDKTPPRVLQTTPAVNAVRVATDTEVAFEFSEKIDRDTFREAIFVSPEPRGELRYSFKGRTARVRFPELLLEERTYVVTAGTDIRDRHNVAMSSSFTLAFSTGDSLDSGEITGRVYADKAQGVLLWAYILPDSGGDAGADPYSRGGDYVTQAGQKGDFTFSHIARGRYRVFAIEDRARNAVYDRGDDVIGIPYQDVRLDAGSARFENLAFRMSREDTIPPGISSASMPSRELVEVRFDESVIARDSTWTSRFNLTAEATGDSIPLLAAVRFPLDPRVFYLRTPAQTSPQSLVLRANGLTDLAGNGLDSAYASATFSASVAVDTLRPRVVRASPEDSARAVSLNADLIVTFSEWMRQDTTESLRVQYGDSTRAPGRPRWRNPFQLVLEPAEGWAGNQRVRVRPDPLKLRDAAGNVLFDTLGTRTFWTLGEDTLSSIAGELKLTPDSLAGLPVRMQATQVGSGKRTYSISLERAGAYRFPNLLPGSYLIEGFLDRNANGTWDQGQARPYLPAEHFFVYSDTVRIRSRWPNEGNDIVVQF